MNNWILPEVKDEIEALEKVKLLRQEKLSEDKFSVGELCPNYVLIDAALWGTDIDLFFENKSIIYRSLFRGSTGKELWNVAPYLVDISKNKEFVKLMKEKDPIERRVTWLSSSLDIDALRKHLRRFLRMKKEDGSYIYSRFYDPFVANTLFPNLTEEQVINFFEMIDFIISDDIRINERRIFHMSSQQKLKIEYQTL